MRRAPVTIEQDAPAREPSELRERSRRASRTQLAALQAIDDVAQDSAEQIAVIVKLGLIGVAAFYAIPRLLDHFAGGDDDGEET